jgi:hypothetical protein
VEGFEAIQNGDKIGSSKMDDKKRKHNPQWFTDEPALAQHVADRAIQMMKYVNPHTDLLSHQKTKKQVSNSSATCHVLVDLIPLQSLPG